MKRVSMKKRSVDIILHVILLVCAIICLYPLLYVFSMSISGAEHVLKRDILFWPKGFSVEGYKIVLGNDNIWRAYGNTILLTVFGTILNIIMTVLAAYPLSRKNFVLKKPVSLMITLTMYISGGMIPFFIVVCRLGLYNNPLGVILPFAVSAWNIIIARSFFESLPDALEDAARIDGASHFTVLTRVMLPLSKPILSVLLLYYAVGHWNSYFWPMILLTKPKHLLLQVFLRNLLILNQDVGGATEQIGISRTVQMEQLKYATIVISVLPIICIYPFIQKYFIQGVTLGAVKE